MLIRKEDGGLINVKSKKLAENYISPYSKTGSCSPKKENANRKKKRKGKRSIGDVLEFETNYIQRSGSLDPDRERNVIRIDGRTPPRNPIYMGNAYQNNYFPPDHFNNFSPLGGYPNVNPFGGVTYRVYHPHESILSNLPGGKIRIEDCSKAVNPFKQNSKI